MTDIKIFRIHLRGDGTDPFRYAYERGISGVGWPIWSQPSFDTVADYNAAARIAYKNKPNRLKAGLRAVKVFACQVDVNHLLWTRHRERRRDAWIHYLGRITGPWRYKLSENRQMSDIAHIRKTEWHEIGPRSALPSSVAAMFDVNQRVTIQEIKDAKRPRVKRDSMELYNRLVGENGKHQYDL